MNEITEKAAAAYLTFQAHAPEGYLADAISEAVRGERTEIEFWLQMDEDSSDEEDAFEFGDVDSEDMRHAVVRATVGKTLKRIQAASEPSYDATYAGYLAA
ncbi:hypothetical protein G8E10_24975 [Rhizobiaceae bacterium CRRU44]|uniref:Uncharacterized protein n=1 Tax=Ferranicluibacter rubi TaxID=2715133 RepID=A0AA43ZJF5_9HYPH|nr:hypothetical protein [Ferranicluibacter rubi]NHT78957.1 hypothetical protein [Ferranicluibacter rubi]